MKYVLVMLWVLRLVGSRDSRESRDASTRELLRHVLCNLPERETIARANSTSSIVCKLRTTLDVAHAEFQCDQEKCECRYAAQRFQQLCKDSGKEIRRTCYGYTKNCTLKNSAFTKDINCEENYDKCIIQSPGVENRSSVGHPLYNPRTCSPGLIPVKDTCNATFKRCRSFSMSQLSTTDHTLHVVNCNTVCRNVETACLNYSKTCNSTRVSWSRGDDASDVTEQCNVTTNKCLVHRYIELIGGGGRIPGRDTDSPPKEVVCTRPQCNATTNLTQSVSTCRKHLTKTMKYKMECVLLGMDLLEQFFTIFYTNYNMNTGILSLVSEEWDTTIKELCNLYCFVPFVRALRGCFEELPLQNVLPGITFPQFEQLLMASTKLLCVSTKEKVHNNSCIAYMNQENLMYKQTVDSITRTTCMEEYREFTGTGLVTTCTNTCYIYLSDHVVNQHDLPGCCIADVLIYKEEMARWISMVAPNLFRSNFILALVSACGLEEKPRSCSEMDLMHPAVIFVIAVLSVFSVVLFVGLVVFVGVSYRQMEYEGFKPENLLVLAS